MQLNIRHDPTKQGNTVSGLPQQEDAVGDDSRQVHTGADRVEHDADAELGAYTTKPGKETSRQFSGVYGGLWKKLTFRNELHVAII